MTSSSLLFLLPLFTFVASRHSSDLGLCAHWGYWAVHYFVRALHTLRAFIMTLLLRNLFDVANYVGSASMRDSSQVLFLSRFVLRLLVLLFFLLCLLHALLVVLRKRREDAPPDTLAALRYCL